jgi:hypothetical protein
MLGQTVLPALISVNYSAKICDGGDLIV